MRKFRTVAAKVIDKINGLGIVRCEEYLVNQDDKLVGHKKVWYDVCLDNGEGDIIDSFKTAKAAKAAATNMKNWR